MIYIENAEYSESVKKLSETGNDSYQLETFGSDNDFYSYDLIVNSDVEKLALNSSCVYEEKRKYDKVFSDYYSRSDLERNSNRTNAIHLIYKLFLQGFGLKQKSKASALEITNSLKLVSQLKEKVDGDITEEEYNIKRKQILQI